MREAASVKFSEKLISAASYLSAGWAGMIILVIMYFLRKSPTRFVQFNVFQSIFISLLFFVVAMCIDLVSTLLSYIPFINYIVAQVGFLLNRPFLGDYSLLQTILSGLILYMVIFSLLGRYPRIFGISKIIDYAVR